MVIGIKRQEWREGIVIATHRDQRRIVHGIAIIQVAGCGGDCRAVHRHGGLLIAAAMVDAQPEVRHKSCGRWVKPGCESRRETVPSNGAEAVKNGYRLRRQCGIGIHHNQPGAAHTAAKLTHREAVGAPGAAIDLGSSNGRDIRPRRAKSVAVVKAPAKGQRIAIQRDRGGRQVKEIRLVKPRARHRCANRHKSIDRIGRVNAATAIG